MAKANSGPISKKSRLARWRIWVQAGFLLAWLDPFLLRMHTVCGPVFHCYSCPLATFACPIGVLANFSALHLIPYFALGTLLAVGSVFGSFVCGWACPFGFLQDLLGRIPTPKFHLPNWTGLFRYVVLAAMVLVIPYLFGEEHPLFFCRLCPAGALEGAVPNTIRTAIQGSEISWPSTYKMAILGSVLGLAVFTFRPWCTLLCPLGAIYSLCNRVSLLFLRFHPDRCRDCAVCRSECSAGGRPEKRLEGMRCVRCLDCQRCRAVTIGSVFSGTAGAHNNPSPELVSLETAGSATGEGPSQ